MRVKGLAGPGHDRQPCKHIKDIRFILKAVSRCFEQVKSGLYFLKICIVFKLEKANEGRKLLPVVENPHSKR